MPDMTLAHFATLLPHAARLALLGFGAAWVALLVHELGHAIGASATGVRLWGIRLGTGPVVYEGPLGSLHLRLAWLPLGGTIQLLDADAHEIGYRDVYQRAWRFTWVPGAWRAPLISAAGPLTSLAVAAIFTATFVMLAPAGHSAPCSAGPSSPTWAAGSTCSRSAPPTDCTSCGTLRRSARRPDRLSRSPLSRAAPSPRFWRRARQPFPARVRFRLRGSISSRSRPPAS